MKQHLRVMMITVFLALLFFTSSAVAWHKPYKQAFKRWTRSYAYYLSDDIYAHFIWTVTYLSRSLLDARVQEKALQYHLSEEGKNAYWHETLEPYTSQPTFFIALYTEQTKWNNLDKPDSIWRVYLHQGDKVCEPAHITRIGKPSPEDSYFFPYVERWDVAYRVDFTSACGLEEDKPFSLEMAGLYGNSTLKW